MKSDNIAPKRLALLTSGGDAPGMNAAIRAVVRAAISEGVEVLGFYGGYPGLIENRADFLDVRSVANIIQRGGTVLKTGRSPEFEKTEGRSLAASHLKNRKVDALVVIGGDGSFRGAHALHSEHGIPVIGVPGTIDNDIFGTDLSIGFDTAVNTALEAIDRIRDTATSHDRVFIVEVMGRNSGFLAASVGLAGGAEYVFTPEFPVPLDKVAEKLKASLQRGKKSSILIAAEGQKPGRAYDLAEQIRKKCAMEAKVCVLGHQQRGGTPSATDRILASRLGAGAVAALLQGRTNIQVGVVNNQLHETALITVIQNKKILSSELLNLSLKLAN
jgi:6-phosphofructokinase 1